MHKIGEFSILSKTTIKTLRFYEEQGLIKPCFVDKFTNYRYYQTSQLADVAKIVSLREIGLSVKEIKRIVDGEDLTVMLEQRKSAIHDEIATRHSQLRKINEILEEKFMQQQIFVKTIPAHTAYFKEGTIKNFGEIVNFVLTAGAECAKDNPNLKCTEPGYCYVNYLDGEYKEKDMKIRYVEAVESAGVESKTIKFTTIDSTKAVCIEHKGSYDNLRTSYNALIKYIEENGLEITDFPRECYIDGCWNKHNENDYLTEIQFPIK